MITGVAYYPEHWPEERWPIDAQMMKDLGLDVVRLAEFAWSKIEPSPGRFEWDWLDRAIEILSNQGMKIILGTPTAAAPAWVARTHPDTLPVDEHGHTRQFGSRRHYCPNSPIYQDLSNTIVEQMGNRYAGNPRIIGWQIDNEFGGGKTGRCYCSNCTWAFQEWLKRRYGSIDELNQAWGTIFWSQLYDDWVQIEPPIQTVTTPNPSQVLDYYRFSSDSIVAYQQQQIDILHSCIEAASQPQFITHNFMGLFQDVNQFDLAKNLDFISWDSYPTGNADRWRSILYPIGIDPSRNDPTIAQAVGDPIITGMSHDLMRSLKKAPFWIMEQQVGPINWSTYNEGVRPGTVRLWVWHAVASGADGMIYFRWRACRYAQEQYHSGLLIHDGSPARGYNEAKIIQAERNLLDKITQEPICADVAILMDYDDLWAIQIQPHRRDFTYLRHLFLYYQVLRKMGVQVDIVSSKSDLTGYKIVIAPTLHLVDAELSQRLEQYVQRGGYLMIGVRSGFKTTSNLVTDIPLPGLLQSLCGVQIKDWYALQPGAGVPISTRIDGLTGRAEIWIENLEAIGSSMVKGLAIYQAGPFEGGLAISENRLGSGKVYKLGFYPSPGQARSLLLWILSDLNLKVNPDLPDGILIHQRGTYTIIMNFREESATFTWEGKSCSIGGRDIMVLNGQLEQIT